MSDNNILPVGWEVATLADVGEIISGGTPSTTVSEYWNGDINWISPVDLSGYAGKYIVKGKKSITVLGLQKSSARLMPKGSVLFSSRAPIGYVAIAADELCTNQGFKSIIPGKSIFNEYLYYFLKFAKKRAEDLASGTTFKEISLTNFAKIQIPLPPLAEQHRIVAKIEELFSNLDKGIERLKAAQQQLKIYRQSVLKWAFEGRFIKNKSESMGLPDGWKNVSLGEIAELCLGKMLDKEKNKGEYQPYLRNINVRWGEFDLSSLEVMRFEDSEKNRYSVEMGDIVVCEGGEPGRCAIWASSNTMYIQKALHRVRLNKNYNPKFIYYYLFYLASNGQLDQYFTGTTIKHLTGRELKRIQIIVPEKCSEQANIVTQIESRFSICDKIEEIISKNSQQAEALRQSILKKAFNGNLVL